MHTRLLLPSDDRGVPARADRVLFKEASDIAAFAVLQIGHLLLEFWSYYLSLLPAIYERRSRALAWCERCLVRVGVGDRDDSEMRREQRVLSESSYGATPRPDREDSELLAAGESVSSPAAVEGVSEKALNSPAGMAVVDADERRAAILVTRVEFVLRVYANASATLGFLLSSVLFDAPIMRGLFSADDAAERDLYTYIAVSLALEVVLALILHEVRATHVRVRGALPCHCVTIRPHTLAQLYRRQFGVSLMGSWTELLASRRHLWGTLLPAIHVSNDVLWARLRLNFE